MSREVDERVVEMQFDNKQFESGVAQTINSLDKLTNALKFEGIGNSIRGIQNGINSMDFSPISNGVSALEGTLTSLAGRIKLEVFDRISKYAVDTGEKIFKALTTQGARAGFAEYETQQGAVQTILANTQHLGTTITDVNAALNDLNEYADLTIYNFTEMTRNIGTFTAAGLDLQTSTSAIKGIANLAAISGSTSEQASRAMYQLSQALAAGRVNLMDWNSVVNAGMGGKVFQDALKRTAKHMGIVVDESKSFRESISGGDTWLSAEVLSETLKQLSGDMDEQTLAAQGWSQSEIEEITKMAKTAVDAATVVKTFSQLMDTVSEQIGSGWTRTWQLIFGDFEESKALWTGVYKAISPYIDAMSDLRNEHLQFWKENEGREKIIQAFSNIWSGVTETISKFTSRFRQLFPNFMTFGNTLVDISDKFLKFSERFRSAEKVAKDAVSATTKMVSSISDAEKAAANAIWYSGKYGNGADRIKNLEAEGLSYEHVQGYLEALIATNFDAAEADKQFMVAVEDASKAVDELDKKDSPGIIDKMLRIFTDLTVVTKNVITDIKKVTSAIRDGFSQVFKFSDILTRITAIADRFRDVSDTIRVTDSALLKLTRISKGFFSIFKIIGDALYGVGMAAFDIFKKLFPTISAVGGNALETAASIGDLIYNFSQTHDVATIVHDAIMTIVDVFEHLPEKVSAAKDAVGTFFGNLLDKVKETTGIDVKGVLENIRDTFGSLFDKLKESTGIDIPGIFSGVLTGLGSVASDIIHLDFKSAFNTISDAVVSFKDTLKAKVDNVDPESIFGRFISAMRNVVSTITEVFKNLFTGSGEEKSATEEVDDRFDFFEWIGNAISDIGEFLSDAASFAAELFSDVFDFIGGFLFDGIDENDSAFEKVKKIIGNIYDIAMEIFKIIAPFEGMSMAKDLTAMPSAVAGFIESAGDAMEGITKRFTGDTSVVGTIDKMVTALLKLAVAVMIFALMNPAKLSVATGAMTFLIGELIGSMVIMQKYLKHDIDYALITIAMSKIGSAIFKLAISVALLSLLNPVGVAVAVGAITLMIADLVGAMVIMNKFIKADIDFSRVTKVFSKLVYAVTILSFVTAMLARKDPAKLAVAVGGVTVLMFAIVGVVAILQKTYNPAHGQTALKNMSYIAALAITIAQAVKTLAEPTAALGKMSPDKMLSGILGITNIMLALTGIVFLLSKIKVGGDAIQTAISLVAATIAVRMLTDSAVALGKEGGDKVLAATGGIYAMVGALAALVGLMILVSKISSPAQILSVSIALLAAVYALQQLVPVMLILGSMNPDNLGTSLIGLGLALLSLTAVLAVLSYVGGANVMLVAIGLLVLAKAVDVLVPPLIKLGDYILPIIERLTKTKWKTIGKGLAIVAIGLAAMLVAGPVLAVFGIGLAIAGAAMLLVSAAAVLAAGAFMKFALALQLIALVWPSVKDVLPELGAQFAKGFVNFVTTFVKGLTDILAEVRKLAPEIAKTLKTIIGTVLDTLAELIPKFADFILKLVINTLTTLKEDLPTILSILGGIITTILNWVESNSLEWTEKLVQILMNILTGIFTGLTSRIDELVTAVFDFIIALNNSIANALNTKGDDVVTSLYKVLIAFIELVKRTIVRVEAKIEEIGGNAIDKIVTGVKKAKNKLVKRVKELFTKDIPEGIDTIWSKLQEIGGNLIDAAVEGIKNSAYKLVEAAKNLGKDALEALTGSDIWDENSPSNATYQAGEYFAEGAELGIEDGAGDVEDASSIMGEDALSAFANNFKDQADFEWTPTMNITPEANIDMSNVKSGLDAYSIDPDEMFADSGFASSFDLSAILGGANAELDAQRHADTEANNALLQILNKHIEALVDSFENGVINIPENATFNVPVLIDGQVAANATAPYLDVIAGTNLDLESKGVTSR